MPNDTTIQPGTRDKEIAKVFPNPEIIRAKTLAEIPNQANIPLESRDLRSTYENRFFFPVTKSNGATLTTSTNIGVYSLADNLDQIVFFTLNIPNNKVIGRIQMIWSTSATSGNGYFQVDISYARDGQTNNAQTTGGTAFAVAAKSGANQLNYTDLIRLPNAAATGINVKLLRPGDIVGIKINRIASNASDTLSAAVLLYGVIITYNNL